MSKPKRYHLEMQKADDGDWVLYSDYARLKAEVEELTGLLKASTYYNTSDEVTRLKAEVERLTNNCNYLDQKLDEELDKSAMLCGQVERLTKAGDAMAFIMAYQKDSEFDGFVEAWNAAKEGKGHE